MCVLWHFCSAFVGVFVTTFDLCERKMLLLRRHLVALSRSSRPTLQESSLASSCSRLALTSSFVSRIAFTRLSAINVFVASPAIYQLFLTYSSSIGEVENELGSLIYCCIIWKRERRREVEKEKPNVTREKNKTKKKINMPRQPSVISGPSALNTHVRW